GSETWRGPRRVLAAQAGYVVHFLFQAEDGIRDRNVTGVQTCALPISISVSKILQSTAISGDRTRSSMRQEDHYRLTLGLLVLNMALQTTLNQLMHYYMVLILLSLVMITSIKVME